VGGGVLKAGFAGPGFSRPSDLLSRHLRREGVMMNHDEGQTPGASEDGECEDDVVVRAHWRLREGARGGCAATRERSRPSHGEPVVHLSPPLLLLLLLAVRWCDDYDGDG
jgi:hypothetical protein